MTSPEPMLLDTNILVYAIDGSSFYHVPSRAVLERAYDHGAKLCVVPQSLAEFYSLVTNPKRVAAPKSPHEALATIDLILALPGLSVLPIPLDLVGRWIGLCRGNPVRGAKIYDLQIIAVMQANGVRRICAYSKADFERHSDILIESP